MKTTISKLMLLCILCFNLIAQAQETETNTKHRISLELDPATFVFKGYSGHLRWQPKKSDHWLLGIGAYAMNMPDALVNINKHNRNRDWEVRLNFGVGMFFEHYSKQVNNGWFWGSQIGMQQYKIEQATTTGTSTFQSSLLMGYTGYTFPIKKSKWYVKPWAGIGYASKISGNASVNEQTYNISPITMFATLHVGYTL
jgi:hypothetical protein